MFQLEAQVQVFLSRYHMRTPEQQKKLGYGVERITTMVPRASLRDFKILHIVATVQVQPCQKSFIMSCSHPDGVPPHSTQTNNKNTTKRLPRNFRFPSHSSSPSPALITSPAVGPLVWRSTTSESSPCKSNSFPRSIL